MADTSSGQPTSNSDIAATRAARAAEEATKLLERMSRAAGVTATASPPSDGLAGSSAATPPENHDPCDGGGVGGQPPASPPSSGGGFRQWWDGQDLWWRVGICIVFGFVLYYATSAFTISQNGKIAESDTKVAKQRAEADNELAKIKAETYAIEKQSARNQKTDSLRVVSGITFDCSTQEIRDRGFATNAPVDVVEGSQILLKNGCAWLRFNHKVTSLSGSGYVLTFDPADDPNPRMCGFGQGGRSDSSGSCIDFVNDRIGDNLRVVINANSSSFLKIGG